ncbi:uncharacterized protein V1518DRAFT_436007 [Limtongia smithiae]|uniref:uncharacterized protein n=1 Tax=Limtongia smithiae TaxID=1125753 RepID=UPI0034CFC720
MADVSPSQSSVSLGSVASLDKPLVQTGSGSLQMSITLAEPILFLQGFDRTEFNNHAPAMLRGSLVLVVTKATKIKSISLNFAGKGRTDWPEGIPPAKDEYFEEKEIIGHRWPFFDVSHATDEMPYGSDFMRDPRGSGLLPLPNNITEIRERERSSSIGRRSLSSSGRRSGSLSRDAADERDRSAAQQAAAKGYKVFAPGKYTYNFEFPISPSLPETIDCPLGSVKYELEATVDRAGAFKTKLVGRKEVILIRSPTDASLEVSEPIVVSRSWEDQLHYDIVVGGKAFPIGSVVPVAFKLTPLAKVRCHRIRILVTENTEYFCRNRKVHRIEPVRKFLLYEELANGSGNGSDNLLGDLDDGSEMAGPIEFEFNAKIPGCNASENENLRLHPDTTYPSVKVHHWIKVILRLSKTDDNDPSRRRHFEVSIDSPIHLLSCRCTQANTSVPAYDRAAGTTSSELPPCPCVASRDLAQVAEDLARPMHLLRKPSMNPPPFDADIPPPPAQTPPPGYDSVMEAEGSYFGAQDFEDEDDEDEDRDIPIRFSGFGGQNGSASSFSLDAPSN